MLTAKEALDFSTTKRKQWLVENKPLITHLYETNLSACLEGIECVAKTSKTEYTFFLDVKYDYLRIVYDALYTKLTSLGYTINWNGEGLVVNWYEYVPDSDIIKF